MTSTHYEVEQRAAGSGGWFPISLPGNGGEPTRFAAIEDAKVRYAGEPFRFVRVVDGWRYPIVDGRCAPYPFCRHPAKCAPTGRCQSDWVCND